MGTISKAIPSNLSLIERLKQKKSNPCLIVDLSSSMNSDIEPGKTKLQALKEIVSGLNVTDIIGFNNTAFVLSKEVIPLASGGTYMAKAINLAKLKNHKAAIMITDGEASDPAAALEAVIGFNLKILYVGPGPKPAFLDKLAQAGGNICTLEDLTATKELEDKLQLLLGDSKNKDIRL